MILVDTHVLLWLLTERSALSRRATDALSRASAILVSAFTFFEIAALVRRGSLRLDRPLHEWSRAVLDDRRFEELPVTWPISASAGALGADFLGDPGDRLIYASARDAAVPLVTKDRRIQEFARGQRDVRVIW